MNQMNPRQFWIWIGLFWLVFCWCVISLRPLLPIDETRYLAVAQEMWDKKEWVLPTIGGAPYSHKTPLLFWLMHGGWSIFGKSEIWPRMIGPILAFASCVLTFALGRQLFPKKTELPYLSVIFLIGMPIFAIYSTLVMFDIMLTVFCLSGWYFLVKYDDKPDWPSRLGWVASLGFAMLAKGPVALIHFLPVALFKRIWSKKKTPWHYELSLILGIVIAAIIPLAWAIPAALKGGPEYSHMIFMGQSAGRMVKSFDHARGFGFYLALAPLYLLPWLGFLPFSKLHKNKNKLEGPVRFLLLQIFTEFLIFSAISGKQIHYLIPLLPLVAITLACGFSENKFKDKIGQRILYILPNLTVGCAVLFAPFFSKVPIEISLVHLVDIGVIVIGLSLLIILDRPRERLARSMMVMTVILATFVFLHIGAEPYLMSRFDPKPTADVLKDLLTKNTVVRTDDFHHAFDFDIGYGNPDIAYIAPEKALDWMKKNPKAYVLFNCRSTSVDAHYYYNRVYLNRYLVIDQAAHLSQNPKLFCARQ